MSPRPAAFLVLSGLLLLCAAPSFRRPAPSDLPGWYPFQPANHFQPGELGLAHWLDAPAGRHGFVQMKADKLVCEDGTPLRFWGVNIGSGDCYPEAARADALVRYWAKYGINGVRLHKFTWEAYKGDSSTALSDAFWRRFDYFGHGLGRQGIYYGWSHIYGHRVRPADSMRLLAYAEIKNLNYPWRHLNGSSASLVNFAEDLQDLNIELTVKMLNHRNPHTRKRYADDPALAFIELQNEDNIFWAAIQPALKQAPSYRRLLCRQFAGWLKGKYADDTRLRAAWGAANLPAGEGIAAENVFPQPDHGLFSHAYLTARKENRPVPRHLLDKMRFLYERQTAYYTRFEKAIRATGYRGVVVASCWQAGSGLSHYYNLHADYRAGMIDRHNYFGGAGHNLDTGRFAHEPMVSGVGSGLLGTGLQQVQDRPFALSEWMGLMPNQWIGEGTPLVALYGMGLQGWDASFHFASNQPGFTKGLSSAGGGVYNADSPLQIGLYPALARMIYRGDVQEGPVVSVRHVSLSGLADGELGFREEVSQGYDDKRFDGDVPPRTLAVGRAVVRFTDRPEPTAPPDLAEYMTGGAVRAATGQLAWYTAGRGVVTANTPATKAVVGFADTTAVYPLGEVSVAVRTPFATVLVTASERDKTLADSRKWIVVAVARGRNTGMAYSPDGTRLLAAGKPPLLLEPVDVTLRLRRPGKASVHVLDHDGMRTGRTVPIKDNAVRLDSRLTRTPYYVVDWEPQAKK